MWTWRRFLAVIGVLLSAALLHHFLPPQHNPLRPPDLTEPVGWATYGKLTALKFDERTCKAALTDAKVEFTELATEKVGTCTLEGTLNLKRSLTPYTAAPLRMTCHQMAALHTWERHIVRPQAEKLFGSPLRQIETYGTFSCRNIAGTRQRSQHAYANAIDISGFVLEDGTRISVKADWRANDEKGKFLKRVHAGACRLFSVTLGPDYNAAHADHFHLDMGSTESCR